MEFGRYRILSQLGQGGMATVYLGEDPLLNRLVAIKVIQSHLSSNTSLIERFTVEAKTIAALRHVNIVEIFDFGVQDDQQFLVMEYIDGQSLQMLCTAMAGQPMPDTVAAAVICQAAEGLTSAEKHGVVHRDIKPENLLFNSEGILKIADFGIAHIADEQSRTQTGAVLGSPNFMSPEQIEGVKPTHKTDLFSLGGVFYYCLTGKLPFTGPSIPVTMRNICDRPHPPVREQNPGADPFLADVIDAMLQKTPEARADGARWLANQLRAWLNSRGIVDIVEHTRNFIGQMGLQNGRTMVEPKGMGSSKFSRPGSQPASGARGRSGFVLSAKTPPGSGMGAASGGVNTYSGHPTTGAMGPSSRSPLVWVGALLTIAILVLAGVLLWIKFGVTPALIVSAPKSTAVSAKPPMVAAKPTVPAAPNPLEVPEEPPKPEARPEPLAAERPIHRPIKIHPVRPAEPQIQRPPAEPVASAPKTGWIWLKSAPPFASITINGKAEGETPMSSYLEVPAGPCHIELVHRLAPPMDTTITVAPGTHGVYKFMLER